MTQVTEICWQKDKSIDVFVPSQFDLKLWCYKPNEGICGICNSAFHLGSDQLLL